MAELKRKSKYDHVQHTLDTGQSTKAAIRKQQEKNFVKGKDELFKRIRTKTLATFFNEEGYDEDETRPPTALSTLKNEAELLRRPDTSETLLRLESEPTKAVEKPTIRSYLLLDVRLKEDFQNCHIVGAKLYPSAMLSRATNEFIPEIYDYRNKDDKYIIVYDEDESISAKVAMIMFQKGIDNIYLLSGGLRDMFEKFPEFVTGKLSPKPGTAVSKTASSRPSSTSTISSTSSRQTTSSIPTRNTTPISRTGTKSNIAPSTALKYASRPVTGTSSKAWK